MTSRIVSITGAAFLCALLVACNPSQPKTIGSLAYTPTADQDVAVKSVSHEEVRSEYSELVDLFEDQYLKEQIERRIADVYMMEGVQEQNQAAGPSRHYVDAIKAYRNILEKYPNSPDNAEVLYQLAKAYDLEGDQAQAMEMLSELTERHPHYVNLAEAHFRMGDIHFNNGDYADSQASYSAVLGYQDPRLATNARYMLGWSYYKQREYRTSLDEFALVLDELMANATDVDALGDAQRPMAVDTIHSMSLALDKVGGAKVISTLPTVADKPYAWLLYDHLGDYYLEKDLYEKAASTFRRYVDTHENSDRAPLLHSKIIHTYIDGGFPSLALEEKETYVEAYGLYSNYFAHRDAFQPEVEASIRTYLDELARHYYNQGEALQEEDDGDKPALADSVELAQREALPQSDPDAINAYEKAADFYAQYAETFPADPRIDEVTFLMSESLFLAQHYADAIPGYERVAYQSEGDSAQAYADSAGYAAIIAYQEHIARLPAGDERVQQWQARAVESMLRFANRFHDDTRAVSVLTNAAEYLFSLREYPRALQVSRDLIDGNPGLDRTLKKTAYGIIAHSHFKLNQYERAAQNYGEQRALIDPESEEYQSVSERLATALYRQSEALGDEEDEEAIVAQLLQIKHLAPDSKLRVPAQYEAVTLMLGMEQWAGAITELKELNALYPEHELSIEFPRRLAYAYEHQENWPLAAEAYRSLADEDPDADTRREALFLAATMFENDERYAEAIKDFRRYAHTYEKPSDILMEARYKLAVNYERIADTDRHLFWLDKIIEGGNQYPETDRNRWLIAWANARYGDHHAGAFRDRALYLPLVESLREKNALLEQASRRYQLAAEQGVMTFTTMSSYKIAELYRQLARELRASPRPSSLSSEERELYRELIEEQANPFDELAMELHQANIDRAWSGKFNEWIDQSFTEMRALDPVRFDKTELIVSYGDEIR